MSVSKCLYMADTSAFVRDTLSFADCEARTIGEAGYQTLAAGSEYAMALTGLLTVFVALIGYRMMLGMIPQVRDGVLASVKIGIVLTLATAWPAYRTLAYDVVFQAPSHLVARIAGGSGVAGARGGLEDRLQETDWRLVELSRAATSPNLSPSVSGGTAAARPLLAFDPIALGAARLLFATSAIGVLGCLWLVGGILLALGPLFVAFLLFDATRGMFVGWLRALGGILLGCCGTAIVLGVEVAMMAPKIDVLIAAQAANRPVAAGRVELLILALVCVVALLGMLAFTTRTAAGLRLPHAASAIAVVSMALDRREGDRPPLSYLPPRAYPPTEIRSRASAVREAVAMGQRRDEARGSRTITAGGRTSVAIASVDSSSASTIRGGAGPQRRNGRLRNTQSAKRRDNG